MDRTEASSSCGSTPSRRASQFAVPFATLMTGANRTENARSGRASVKTARTGRAITSFFGMSSPADHAQGGGQRQSEGDRNTTGGLVAERAFQRRLDEAGDGRLRDEAEHDRHERHAELRPDRWKDSVRDMASARLARRLPGLRQRFEAAALDGDQGELGRDEERRAEHE